MAQVLSLPAPLTDGPNSVESVLHRRRSVREFAQTELALAALGQLLWAAQGVNRPDGGRTAPSAGALYPLEVYVVIGQVEGLAAGVYRYAPRGHELVRVLDGDQRLGIGRAAAGQQWVSTAAVLIVFGSVDERTAQKYGERGIRYVHMEVGHAAQNVAIQAAALHLGTVVVGAFDDAALRRLLRMGDETRPLCIMPVGGQE